VEYKIHIFSSTANQALGAQQLAAKAEKMLYYRVLGKLLATIVVDLMFSRSQDI